jgi:hypothetical protein
VVAASFDSIIGECSQTTTALGGSEMRRQIRLGRLRLGRPFRRPLLDREGLEFDGNRGVVDDQVVEKNEGLIDGHAKT